MPDKQRADSCLCILDCVSGARVAVQKSPFVIGSLPSSDLRLSSPSSPQVLCTIIREGGTYQISLASEVLLNGAPSDSFQSAAGEEHSVVGRGCMLALKQTDQKEAWLGQGKTMSWNVYDTGVHDWLGPFGTQQLRAWLARLADDARRQIVLLPAGMEEVGFFVKDVQDLLAIGAPADRPVEEKAWFQRQTAAAGPAGLSRPRPATSSTGVGAGGGVGRAVASAPDPVAAAAAEEVNSAYGEFTCPICWFKFDRGDVMNVAVHQSQRGDPLLGGEQMRRFHATRFNDRGQALDAAGVVAPELACPHCRRKLPPGFLDTPHQIFSIVGAPSSGKSYYLSVLIKMLQNSLFQTFGITFRDADPSENVILTQMRAQLFSAATPQDAFLAKTDLEGALYETLPRQGRKVRLPKPFVFKLSHANTQENDFSVVFYDNAGEHFEPTSNSADSPGAQHIAVASGIFFLFDPLHNTEFRHKLSGAGVSDPQIKGHRMDQQDVILAESEVRIKSLLGLDTRERITTPLAVMVGKCDTWLPLLGGEPLLPAVVNGLVSQSNIQANSRRVRALLLELCPAIVANAEAISSRVCYFAISPLGTSPVEFQDAEGHVRIGPDPRHIRPRHVEAPTLWVLSQTAPGMFPSEPGSL
ncbi:MAG: FHA domain-containing protein [Prosthecobacter sp.]